jgi:PPK2 family polyphosphate:nucleotide phosphotransferase
MAKTLRDTLRLAPGPGSIDSHDARATPGFSGGKNKGKRALAELSEQVAALQERLYAESRVHGTRSILLVLQGMDTSGKSGTIKHCLSLLEPQGVAISSFRAPTAAEKRHDFLWRIERRAPAPGMIAIFDRSHYEDVLVARVHELAPKKEVERRYGAINDFEQGLADAGTTVVKCFLHITKDIQGERLLARLEDPTKLWKFNPGDIDERRLWPDYQRAYEIALERCNTDSAPWYVIASDHKWYRNWAVTALLLEHLQDLDPQWPQVDFDVEEQKLRLRES